ncbi:MAG TPA: hypothetical protein VGH55_00370 [Chthoniobacterales bacterium]
MLSFFSGRAAELGELVDFALKLSQNAVVRTSIRVPSGKAPVISLADTST